MFIFRLSLSVHQLTISLDYYTDIMKLKTLKGLALEDILKLVHVYVHRSKCIKDVVVMGGCTVTPGNCASCPILPLGGVGERGGK